MSDVGVSAMRVRSVCDPALRAVEETRSCGPPGKRCLCGRSAQPGVGPAERGRFSPQAAGHACGRLPSPGRFGGAPPRSRSVLPLRTAVVVKTRGGEKTVIFVPEEKKPVTAVTYEAEAEVIAEAEAQAEEAEAEAQTEVQAAHHPAGDSQQKHKQKLKQKQK